MKVKFELEIDGLEHWGLTVEERNDQDYWKGIIENIKESLEDEFGYSFISVNLKGFE